MLSRRKLLERAAAGAVAIAAPVSTAGARQTTSGAAQSRFAGDLVLTNGKFVDGRGQIGTTLTIRNGRIASVGKATPVAPDARRIDLDGRS
ncbi:MAG TPA: hypothetical protein VIZ32_06370, partial [Vicinamibacterales bacterium]